MEPETPSPSPISPAPVTFVRNALLVGLFALLCILASNLIVGTSFGYCGGNPASVPWWFQLALGALFYAWLPWIIAVGFALSRYSSSKMGCGGSIQLLGGLNMLLAFLLFFWSIYTFFVCAVSG
jgi:hypothetical protein